MPTLALYNNGFYTLPKVPVNKIMQGTSYAEVVSKYGVIYSIKSHLGKSATLFNSSTTSGFVYRVIGIDEEGMNKINANADSFVSTMEQIKSNYGLEYIGCRNDTFYDNLSLVDSRMDEIMQCAVLITLGYYGDCQSRKLTDICEELVRINPLRHRHPEYFYEVNLKELLFDSFAGMTASNTWDGQKNLSGGYLDVSPDGTVLFYRAMSDSVFSNYLFTHTYMDFPDKGLNCALAVLNAKTALENRTPTQYEIEKASTSPSNKPKTKKGDWGYIYKNNSEYFLAVNFQIRFK